MSPNNSPKIPEKISTEDRSTNQGKAEETEEEQSEEESGPRTLEPTSDSVPIIEHTLHPSIQTLYPKLCKYVQPGYPGTQASNDEVHTWLLSRKEWSFPIFFSNVGWEPEKPTATLYYVQIRKKWELGFWYKDETGVNDWRIHNKAELVFRDVQSDTSRPFQHLYVFLASPGSPKIHKICLAKIFFCKDRRNSTCRYFREDNFMQEFGKAGKTIVPPSYE